MSTAKDIAPQDPMTFAKRKSALIALADNWLSVAPFERQFLTSGPEKTGEFPKFAVIYANNDGEHTIELIHYPSDIEGKPVRDDIDMQPWQLVDLDTGKVTAITTVTYLRRSDETYDILPDADELEEIRDNLA